MKMGAFTVRLFLFLIFFLFNMDFVDICRSRIVDVGGKLRDKKNQQH